MKGLSVSVTVAVDGITGTAGFVETGGGLLDLDRFLSSLQTNSIF